MAKSFFILLLGLMATSSYAQLSMQELDTLYKYELKLQKVGMQMVDAKSVLVRQQAARDYIKLLRTTLQKPGAYQYGFDSLHFMSRLRAPDDSFRLFSWILQLSPNKYRYFAVIHLNRKAFVYHPLFDRSVDVASGQLDGAAGRAEENFLQTDNENWQGCYYYALHKVTHRQWLGLKKTPYYILLGWDGNNGVSHKKIVDVLTFKEGKPHFGAPIIETDNGMQTKFILEYNARAVVTLKYHDKHELISFDHLEPPSAKNEGHYFTYIPSGQSDYLIWRRKKFVFKEDLFNTYKKEIKEAN